MSAYGIFLSQRVVVTQFLCEIFILDAHADQLSCH